MAVVRPDRSRAAGKGREHEDGTERGKKNGSHNWMITPLVSIQPILCKWGRHTFQAWEAYAPESIRLNLAHVSASESVRGTRNFPGN